MGTVRQKNPPRKLSQNGNQRSIKKAATKVEES
jgi:hypothetical protein